MVGGRESKPTRLPPCVLGGPPRVRVKNRKLGCMKTKKRNVFMGERRCTEWVGLRCVLLVARRTLGGSGYPHRSANRCPGNHP